MNASSGNGYGWRYCLDGSTVRNYVLLNASPSEKKSRRDFRQC